MNAGFGKKRICIVTGAHSAKVQGGAQYQAGLLAEELGRRSAFEVYYLARQVDPKYRPGCYRIRQVGFDRGVLRRSLLFDAPCLIAALKVIKPSIIYQRVLHSYTGISAAYAATAGCRLIFHISSDLDVLPRSSEGGVRNIFSRAESVVGRYGLRRADTIVAQTNRQSELLEQMLGRRADLVVPNFHPLPTEKIEKSTPTKVIWIGNFKRVKRPEIFVRLARELAPLTESEFVMLGRTGDNEQFEDLHREIARTPNLVAVGERPLEHVNRYLAQGHILVNTSVAEGFSNTFIQAWMRGVPVVSLGVNPDNVLDKFSLGYSASSFDELKQLVVRLISDEPLRSALGENARKYAIQYHSLANVGALIAKFDA
jgi:glycosyltransferase involved in cell wall biosynthesis